MARRTKDFWDGQPLGEMSDEDLARRLRGRVSKSAVRSARQRRGIPSVDLREPVCWDDVDLGERPDEEIAADFAVDPTTVCRARKTRGIPPANGRSGWTPVRWSAQPLGKVPDTHIASDLGISTASVCIARNKRGIAPAPASMRNTRWGS